MFLKIGGCHKDSSYSYIFDREIEHKKKRFKVHMTFERLPEIALKFSDALQLTNTSIFRFRSII